MQSNLSLYKETNFNWVHSTLLKDRIDAKNYKVEYLELQRKIISQTYIRLRDVIEDIKNGFEVNRSYSDVGLKFLTVKDLKEFEINYSDIKKIDLHFRDIPEKGRLKEGDIIITRSGSIGIAKTITNNDEDIVISSDIIKLRVNNKIDRDYLTTYLNSDTGRKLIEQLSYGAVMKKIGQEELLDLLIPIPSPEIQKYIGDKVRKAEELREEAKRLKKEAEEILNAELKLSYFNERVKDAPKIYNWIYGESIEIRIDSQYYINETNFINNEMYKKGLKLKRISEIANVGKGFSYTSLDNKSIPYIRISDLDDLLINFDTAELVDEKTYSEKKSSQLEKYDLIFAITGATIGKVSLFYNSKYSKATLSSDTAFVRLKDKNDAAYVLLYLKSFIGQLGILKGVTGATNRHLSLEHIGDIFIPVIDNKLKQEINMRVIKAIDNVYLSKQLIKEAKQDVEDLIEGNFDMSKVKANS